MRIPIVCARAALIAPYGYRATSSAQARKQERSPCTVMSSRFMRLSTAASVISDIGAPSFAPGKTNAPRHLPLGAVPPFLRGLPAPGPSRARGVPSLSSCDFRARSSGGPLCRFRGGGLPTLHGGALTRNRPGSERDNRGYCAVHEGRNANHHGASVCREQA